jgi:hypothetical protein
LRDRPRMDREHDQPANGGHFSIRSTLGLSTVAAEMMGRNNRQMRAMMKRRMIGRVWSPMAETIVYMMIRIARPSSCTN